MPDLEPLLRVWRALDGLFAVEERAWWGAVVSDARYPDVQEANYARVESTRSVGLEEVEATLAPVVSRAGCRREHVVVFFPEAQTDLLVQASTRGERLVWDLVMVHDGDLDEGDDRVREVGRPDERFWRAHRDSARHFDVRDERVLDQLSAIEREVLVPSGRRWFVVPDDAGEAEAFAALVVLDGVGFVDHVVTLPEARRRGHATALTRRLVLEARAAGAERTYLLTEPHGVAEALYGRLGFARVTQITSWVAPLDRAVGR
ncbi:MAG TPA: GNAT family N-acetyltransferase [Actinomycetota bacterium]|nr:GNAT family N-acetyltransferase [Actinomycetota bacterium]